MSAQPTIPGDLLARTQTIAGLRALADFLEANPGVPVHEYGWEVRHHTRGTDEEEAAEIDRIAALLDATPADERNDGGHYTASKTFGHITYTAVHIPARRMDAHHALMSYAPAFRPQVNEEAA